MVRTGSGGPRQDSRAADEAPWRLRVLVHGNGADTGDGLTPGRTTAGRRARVAGAGVLLPDGLAVTCAHVVEAALRRARSPEAPPDTFEVDFPAVRAGTARATARVAEGGWFRGAPANDLAVLRLDGATPPGAAAAPVDAALPGADVPVLVFGHPSDVPDGVWAWARTVATGGPHPGWLQLDGDGQGARIERGFSGAGVWDRRSRRVTGLVSSVLDSSSPVPTRVAWMIPFALLTGTPFAHLFDGGAVTAPAGPWDVVNALLATGVATPDGGRGLLSLLPDRIAGGVPREDRPRLQMFHLVRRCDDFTEGPRELVRAVRELEGDSISVRHFVEQARRMWPDRLDGPDEGRYSHD